jgi:hypothetical protein
VRKKIFSTGPTRAAEAEKNLLYRHDKPYELTKEGPLLLVLIEYPYTSVSSVSRGHLSLFSLIWPFFESLGFASAGSDVW